MKAVVNGEGGVTVAEVDEPDGPGARLEIRSSSICGTDLNFIAMGATGFVYGHEFAGVVDGVPYAIEPTLHCGTCEQCIAGHTQRCTNGAANLGRTGLKVAIVASRFNEGFCSRLLAGAQAELAKLGVGAADVETVRVPGALEIPMALQWLAQTSRFDALIALGVVIRGETYHFDLVANESSRGVMEVQLETGVPVANAIITTENEAQAEARIGKGAEAARVAVEMALLRARVARQDK